jgi:hypothetical protein
MAMSECVPVWWIGIILEKLGNHTCTDCFVTSTCCFIHERYTRKTCIRVDVQERKGTQQRRRWWTSSWPPEGVGTERNNWFLAVLIQWAELGTWGMGLANQRPVAPSDRFSWPSFPIPTFFFWEVFYSH